jgi:hypothetical protein
MGEHLGVQRCARAQSEQLHIGQQRLEFNATRRVLEAGDLGTGQGLQYVVGTAMHVFQQQDVQAHGDLGELEVLMHSLCIFNRMRHTIRPSPAPAQGFPLLLVPPSLRGSPAPHRDRICIHSVTNRVG